MLIINSQIPNQQSLHGFFCLNNSPKRIFIFSQQRSATTSMFLTLEPAYGWIFCLKNDLSLPTNQRLSINFLIFSQITDRFTDRSLQLYFGQPLSLDYNSVQQWSIYCSSEKCTDISSSGPSSVNNHVHTYVYPVRKCHYSRVVITWWPCRTGLRIYHKDIQSTEVKRSCHRAWNMLCFNCSAGVSELGLICLSAFIKMHRTLWSLNGTCCSSRAWWESGSAIL